MNKSILVVDNDEDLLELLQVRFQSKGCRVIPAKSGMQAMEKLKEQIPDMIILDIMMPGMNGYEVCQALKFNPLYKQIPILILTARNEEIDFRIIKLLGIQYMQKPFESDELWSRVEQILK